MRQLTLLTALFIFINILSFGQRNDLSGLKFCIDPGHGGFFDATDRHVIPDPGTNFYESESNFRKALYLKSLLEARDASVILTRYTNDYPNDEEPDLPTRVAIANSNNVNWFHSIHSNATGGVNTSTNYTLMLVREKRSLTYPYESSAPGLGIPERQESLTMANIMGRNIKNFNRTSRTSTYLDWTFYGGANGGFSLGVLRGLSMPGELSEGSFHDYYPETRRLMNANYRKVEAYAIRNSIMEYYGVPNDTTSIIAGIIKDVTTLQPINNIKVRLLPNDTICNGDQYNNGYYMFDNLKPGSYTLLFETANCIKDSVNVTIQSGNTITFVDKNLFNTVPPKITGTTPINGDTTVSVYNPVTINFSKPMDTTSVRKSFSTNPSLNGLLTWLNSNTTLLFTPSSKLESKTIYLITIDTVAMDLGGYKVDGNGDGVAGDQFQLNFKTLISDEERPNILSTLPIKTPVAQDFSTQGVISIAFTKLMDTNSLKNGISLRRYSIDVESDLYFTNFQNSTIVTLKPKNSLIGNSSYVVFIYNTIKDIYQSNMKNTYYFNFNTGSRTYKNIQTLESYSSGINNWWQPSGSGSTIGTINQKTTFSEDNTIFLPWTQDKKSAKLNFEWDTTSSNYLLREYLSQDSPYNTLIDTSLVLLTYVFGDGSKNKIRFCVDDSSDLKSHRVNNWMTVDWYGWKLIEWKLTNSSELGYWFTPGPIIGPKVRFDSYQLTYEAGNSKSSGFVYFDELRIAEIDNTTNKIEYINNFPSEYELKQNYPNPFNPTTNIEFRISSTTGGSEFVTLKIFDVLGREIMTLVNEELRPGEYKVEFDARGLSSGIYFYRLTTPNFIQMKKMEVLK
jgi:N-acetylmuramoyl-L-alanine amidase